MSLFHRLDLQVSDDLVAKTAQHFTCHAYRAKIAHLRHRLQGLQLVRRQVINVDIGEVLTEARSILDISPANPVKSVIGLEAVQHSADTNGGPGWVRQTFQLHQVFMHDLRCQVKHFIELSGGPLLLSSWRSSAR